MVHSGEIKKITNSTITVALEGNINCEGCKAKAACGVSESNAKEIEVENIYSSKQQLINSFNLNERVTILMEEGLGLKAVFWAYVFPFILLIMLLVVTSMFLLEWQAGLLSIAMLVPYYISLYFLNPFFKKRFKVSILKMT